MKVWATIAEKEPRPVEVLAKGGGSTEWIVDRGGYACQLRPRDPEWIVECSARGEESQLLGPSAWLT